MNTLRCQWLDEQRLHQEERESSSQLVSNSLVQMKMKTFHAHFATLTFPKCSTCLESFPELQLRHPTTECMRCCRDKHTPKVYSSANNTDPGPLDLPPQLQVSFNTISVHAHEGYSSQFVCLLVVLTARNDGLINSFNPIQLSAWCANVDMQYCVSRHKVIKYCAKYATKSEPHSQPLKEIFCTIVRSLKEDSSFLKAVQKFLINSSGVARVWQRVALATPTLTRSY